MRRPLISMLVMTVGTIGLISLPIVSAEASPRERSMAPGMIFRDCADCPEMIVTPAGSFVIGSPAGEPGRASDEGPQRRIHVGSIAVGRFEITRRQFALFLKRAGRAAKGGCMTDRRHPGDWAPDDKTDFHDPGFHQSADHPAACVSWHDAKAYVAWLSAATGRRYRLLREAEWEYVARAATTTAYPWGATPHKGCTFMNGFDETALEQKGNLYRDEANPYAACSDGFVNTAPVGSFAPNHFGIFDMIGNLGEWLEDCATPSYASMRSDGSSVDGDCSKRMVRGGSWGTMPTQLRAAERMRYSPDAVDDSIGIRVASDIGHFPGRPASRERHGKTSRR
ncbi:MAG TPA: SUMF1/EgtB/PvdO family nonheme iron enzyme [Sphingomicrobium sp.]|nr:SUMF1/EgtB/PvdO family nonheme iron enzyme [Sphingomicrobium sp.]